MAAALYHALYVANQSSSAGSANGQPIFVGAVSVSVLRPALILQYCFYREMTGLEASPAPKRVPLLYQRLARFEVRLGSAAIRP